MNNRRLNVELERLREVPMKEFHGYHVYMNGHVYSPMANSFVKPIVPIPSRNWGIVLSIDGKSRQVRLNKLIYILFSDDKSCKEEDLFDRNFIVYHRDGNKANFDLNNLTRDPDDRLNPVETFTALTRDQELQIYMLYISNIILADSKTNQSITVDMMAKMFGVSSITIRNAINRLDGHFLMIPSGYRD